MRSNSNTPPNREITGGFSFLPWGYSSQISEKCASTRSLRDSLEILIEVLPEEILIKNEVSNLSGGLPAGINGSSELLRISYSFKDSEMETAEPGEFTIASKFSRFDGSRAIVFSLERNDSFGANNPREILLDDHKTVTSFALSIDWYERRWASLFGNFPVATQRLRLTCLGDEISAIVSVQRQSSKEKALNVAESIIERWLKHFVP